MDHPQLPDAPRPWGDPDREGRRPDLTWLGCLWLLPSSHSWSPGVTVAVSDPTAAPYLLCDCAGTLDELPLGVAVGGAHLEGPRLLHQEDTAVAQVLHTSTNLEADLWRQPGWGSTSIMDPAVEVLPMWKISPVSYGSLARKIPLLLGVCAW